MHPQDTLLGVRRGPGQGTWDTGPSVRHVPSGWEDPGGTGFLGGAWLPDRSAPSAGRASLVPAWPSGLSVSVMAAASTGSEKDPGPKAREPGPLIVILPPA